MQRMVFHLMTDYHQSALPPDANSSNGDTDADTVEQANNAPAGASQVKSFTKANGRFPVVVHVDYATT